MDKGKITMDTGIGLTVKVEINPTIEVEEVFTITEVIGPIIELRSGSRNYGYGNGYR